MTDASTFLSLLQHLDQRFGHLKGIPSPLGCSLESFALSTAYRRGVSEVLQAIHELFEEASGRTLELPMEAEITEVSHERLSADQYLLKDVQPTQSS